ncbi:preprotein translocase subunit SecD [Methanocella sp. MCL-LM]|uniref:preprotein translocase subunit SecD n=1 Tax=Methanocella sp. MCL-LM TaxID=3412035 RepID=UPI003C73F0DC
MAEKGENIWVKILTDYRVIALIICLLLSAIFIGPTISNGQLVTNLKFGLDFEGGSQLKLKLINQSGSNNTITDEQLELTKGIMETKVNAFGLKNIPIATVRDGDNNAYMLIDFAGINYSEAMEILGTPGQFEMRIQTGPGNESEHILYGDSVLGVSVISQTDGSHGVSFSLKPEGAQKFHDVASKYDILRDPNNHQVMMLLDGKEFHRAPIAPSLAQTLLAGPVDQAVASTGTGEEGIEEAKKVYVHMSAGALPFGVEVVSSGQVPAEQGAQFKTMAIIAMVLAQLAIGAIMYIRYREPRIIVPMFLTSLFEVFILLGFATMPFVRWEIDLPSVAAIIAVIGTGIDQLIIITDEVMTTGRAPTTKKILQKMTQAFKIIFASAATVVVAMIPLYFMGFGALRGFALTTIVGVAIGILITRPAYGKIISEILNK